MIIIMDPEHRLTVAAAQHLAAATKEQIIPYHHKLDLKNLKGSKITFIDLRADGVFQERFDAGYFADKLCKEFKMPVCVTLIDYLIAENQKVDSMIAFAHDFVQRLKNEHGRDDFTVRTLSDPTYRNILLTPPINQNKKWQVHGMRSNVITDSEQPLNYQILYACQPKKLLWDGENLEDWLDDLQRIRYASPPEWEPVSDEVPKDDVKEKEESHSTPKLNMFFQPAAGKQLNGKRKQNSIQMSNLQSKAAKMIEPINLDSADAIKTVPSIKKSG